MSQINRVTDAQLWLAAGVVATVILACTPKPEPKTVGYYVDNNEARTERLAVCKNNSGTLKDDPDCVNAKQAAMTKWSSPDLPRFDPTRASGQAQAGSAAASASTATR